MKHSFHLKDDQFIFPDGKTCSLYSEQAFEILSELWLKVGWNAHYHYSFTWMGQPVLQLPEDLITLQEVIVDKRPDIIIETGIAMGGSLLFYASICHAIDHGRVIGIDIDLRPQNRKKIEASPFSHLITLIDGDSSKPTTVDQLEIEKDKTVMVILDSNHSMEHVAQELEIFAPIVSPNHYLVVADGFKKSLSDVPRGKPEWKEDNPVHAIEKFLEEHPYYQLEFPCKQYNRCSYRQRVTHFQGGWLKRAPNT